MFSLTSRGGRLAALLGLIAVGPLLLLGPAAAQDKIRFATNWVAEAEHGGFYQAVADGTYARYGLEVEILPGGPNKNNALLLATGKIEFLMGGNMLEAFSAIEQGIPTTTVASIFQKEPQIFMTHPGQGLDSWESLKDIDILVGQGGLSSFYQWMVAEYGFSLERVRPYTYNAAPFLADKRLAQQGYVTSEPYTIEKEGGFKPNIFLLADFGYDSYSTTIVTRNDLLAENPDLIQRFVDASAIGWYNYLYHDPSAGNALIQKDNPDMSAAQIAYSIDKLKAFGIVDSGDSLTLGIGAMTEARHKSFFDRMVRAGVVAPDLDYKKSYRLDFVNKGVGLDLRPAD